VGKKSRIKKERRNETQWTPFALRTPVPKTQEQKEAMAKACGVSVFEIEQSDSDNSTMYQNNLYTVHVREVPPEERGIKEEIIHLSIRRNDREPIHDWRHFQRIKNELVGPKNEGVELYPAESRVVDTVNQYHLWVFKDPQFCWNLGWTSGLRMEQTHNTGSKQRNVEIS